MMAGILVGTFKLTCVGDGNVLDLPEANLTNGTKVTTYPIYHGAAHQKWIGAVSEPENGIVIGGSLTTALYNGTTGKVLDAAQSPANGVVINQFQGQKKPIVGGGTSTGQPVLLPYT